MSIFQLIAILFALFMIYVIRVKNRKYHLSVVESVAWYALWLSFVFLALFPNMLLGIVDTLKFDRVFDLLIVAAFMILTTLLVFVYFKMKDLDQKLEKYVRDDSQHVEK
jgi:hypothetical protein